MVNGKAKLIVDLGNSETRSIVLYGKKGGDDKSKPKRRVSTFSNIFYPLTNNKDWEPPQGTEDMEAIIFEAHDPDLGRYGTGPVLDREFSQNAIRPSAITVKYDSLPTKLALRRAFLEAYISLSEMTNNPIKDIDVTWDVFVLLPPIEVERGSDIIKRHIRDIKEIDFIRPNITKEIKINNVSVYPEGVSAFFALLISPDGDVVQDNVHLGKDARILLIDIGAGTTDISLVENGNALENSQETIKIGGNNIAQRVMGNLKKKDGIIIRDSEVKEGLQRGWVRDGKKRIPIVNHINAANELVAQSLLTGIQSFFEMSQMPIQSIEYLFVFGGGSIKSMVEGVKSIQDYLYDNFKVLSENIELLESPKSRDGSSVSPRMMNIYGAANMSQIFGGRDNGINKIVQEVEDNVQQNEVKPPQQQMAPPVNMGGGQIKPPVNQQRPQNNQNVVPPHQRVGAQAQQRGTQGPQGPRPMGGNQNNGAKQGA